MRWAYDWRHDEGDKCVYVSLYQKEDIIFVRATFYPDSRYDYPYDVRYGEFKDVDMIRKDPETFCRNFATLEQL